MRRSRMPYYLMNVYPGATVNEDQKSKTKDKSHKTKVEVDFLLTLTLAFF